MTDKLRAAAKAALETLDCGGRNYSRAANILRAALAEPEQEPVGWLHWLTVDGERFPQLTLMPRTDKDEPLYTAPPRREWVGLTDDDKTVIKKLVTYDQFETAGEYANRVQAATEFKLKEKNT